MTDDEWDGAVTCIYRTLGNIFGELKLTCCLSGPGWLPHLFYVVVAWVWLRVLTCIFLAGGPFHEDSVLPLGIGCTLVSEVCRHLINLKFPCT
jgi:hypothetical protein